MRSTIPREDRAPLFNFIFCVGVVVQPVGVHVHVELVWPRAHLVQGYQSGARSKFVAWSSVG